MRIGCKRISKYIAPSGPNTFCDTHLRIMVAFLLPSAYPWTSPRNASMSNVSRIKHHKVVKTINSDCKSKLFYDIYAAPRPKPLYVWT